jgi:hypothetical protein
MSTTSFSAIPFDSLSSMQKAGYRFRLNGKVISMSELLKLKNTVSVDQKAKVVTDEGGDPVGAISEVDLNNISVVMGETEDDIRKESEDRPDPETKPTKPVHINPVTAPADKPEPTPINPPVNPPSSAKKGRSTKKVYCKETDTVYDSMSAAGRALGLDPAAVSYAAANGRPTKGYNFSVVTD